MQTPFYFLHIPKTAGSSVERWLASRVGEDNLCPAKNWDQLVELHGDLCRYRVFSGHFGSDLDRFLGTDLKVATVIRNPLERARSHYLHVARDTNHPRFAFVSRQTFDQFVKDRQNWPMIENFQARYLVRSAIDFRRYARVLDQAEAKGSMLSVLSEDSRYMFDANYVHETALKALLRLDAVGTTENLADFLERITAILSLGDASGTADVPFYNAAPRQQTAGALSEEAFGILRALTRVDSKLLSRGLRTSGPRLPDRLLKLLRSDST